MATVHQTAAAQTDAAQVHAGTDHIVGTMNVDAHRRTFDGFVKWAMWSFIASAAVLIFLALANS